MKKFYFSALGLCMALSLFAQRNELSLEKGWKFTKGEMEVRSHFAEFLSYSSLAHLRILSSPMCVHFRYGPYILNVRNFSWKFLHCLPYSP